MAILDATALSNILEIQYTQNKVNLLSYDDNTFYAQVPKRTNFVGKTMWVAIRIGAPMGRGPTVAIAQANKVPSLYKAWNVSRVVDYTTVELTGEAIDASGTDNGALLVALKAEMDGGVYTSTRNIAYTLYRNGGGARGQVASGQTTTTITLTNPTDVTNFEVGMILQFSAADGTSGTAKTGSQAITGIDRDLGTLTAAVAWNTNVTTIAANDFIFQNGDCQPALYSTQTGSQLKGLAAWLPIVAPTPGDAFFGVDRSADATRLAGVRYLAGQGGPIEETLVELATRICREGGRPSHCYINPLDWSALVKSLGTKVVYDRSKSFDEAEIGFDSVKLMGPKGSFQVMADLNCPKGQTYMLTMKDWYFLTLKGAPRVLDLDGLRMVRAASNDSYEARIGWYGNLICEAPGHSGTALL